MVNYTHAPHFAADSFKRSGRKIIFITKGCQDRQKLRWRVFKLNKDGQKNPLMIPIAGEQDFCKLIQSVNPGDFVPIQLDFGARYIIHPYIFIQNRAFERVGRLPGDVKIFSVRNWTQKENRHFPETLRFREVSAQPWGLTAKYTSENGLSTVSCCEILGGQKPLQLGIL